MQITPFFVWTSARFNVFSHLVENFRWLGRNWKIKFSVNKVKCASQRVGVWGEIRNVGRESEFGKTSQCINLIIRILYYILQWYVRNVGSLKFGGNSRDCSSFFHSLHIIIQTAQSTPTTLSTLSWFFFF